MNCNQQTQSEQDRLILLYICFCQIKWGRREENFVYIYMYCRLIAKQVTLYSCLLEKHACIQNTSAIHILFPLMQLVFAIFKFVGKIFNSVSNFFPKVGNQGNNDTY